ncbi:hypothetical protein [Dickeya sp. NCPPB 3274]|uniref:hypothetical protein n=1 Tax=Dickeya sp. NCPPB 3274 TaxID=568766 RepID=UPI0005B311A7|nr:hypothetical protein [Dickeya sp. NCPPB 3274]
MTRSRILFGIKLLPHGMRYPAYLQLYLSYFKLQGRWLRSLTQITYLSKLIGIHSLAALQGSNEPCPEGPTLRVVQNAKRFVLQLELF